MGWYHTNYEAGLASVTAGGLWPVGRQTPPTAIEHTEKGAVNGTYNKPSTVKEALLY